MARSRWLMRFRLVRWWQQAEIDIVRREEHRSIIRARTRGARLLGKPGHTYSIDNEPITFD